MSVTVDTWLPEGENTRKTFVALVLVTCAFLIFLRFMVFPDVFGYTAPKLSAAFDETVGNVIATTLAGTGLAVLLLWLFPPPRRPAVVESLPANEISGQLERAMSDATMWWFDG